MPPLPRLDHVVLNAQRALGAAAARYEGLGFMLAPSSRHTLGSMNRVALFADHYLELLGIDPQAAAPRDELMRAAPGLSAIVFATDDAESLYRDLAAAGAPVEPPREFSRPLAGGTARFRTMHVAADAVSYGRIYFCEHLTRELVWGAASHAHANGATSIARVVIAARDPTAAAGLYRILFGDGALVSVADGWSLAAGATRIDILPPVRVAREFAAAETPDRIAAVTFRTGGTQRRIVSAAEACGAILEFAPG